MLVVETLTSYKPVMISDITLAFLSLKTKPVGLFYAPQLLPCISFPLCTLPLSKCLSLLCDLGFSLRLHSNWIITWIFVSVRPPLSLHNPGADTIIINWFQLYNKMDTATWRVEWWVINLLQQGLSGLYSCLRSSFSSLHASFIFTFEISI